MKTEFNTDWQNWIKTNVDSGQDKNGIFKILLDEGYSYQAIVREMQFEPTVPVDQLINPFAAAQPEQKQAGSDNYGQPIGTDSLFIPNGKPINSESLQLYTVADFLNSDECEHIKLFNHKCININVWYLANPSGASAVCKSVWHCNLLLMLFSTLA